MLEKDVKLYVLAGFICGSNEHGKIQWMNLKYTGTVYDMPNSSHL